MDQFTPWAALAGGLLIGTAATMLLLLNGQVAGISGILAGLLPGRRGGSHEGWGWRAAFVAGLVLAPAAYLAAGGAPPAIEVEAPAARLAVAGLLVGFGTRLGSGCTSGHAVCGIGRGSARSIWATVTFVAVAMLTVLAARLLGGG